MPKSKLIICGLIAILLVCGCLPAAPSPGGKNVSQTMQEAGAAESPPAEAPIIMGQSPQYDSFDDFIADLERYYAMADLTDPQREEIAEYLTREKLPGSMARMAYDDHAGSATANLKQVLSRRAKSDPGRFSDPISEAERQEIREICCALLDSDLVSGFSTPVPLNPYNLLRYCAHRSGEETLTLPEITQILSHEFGSAFLAYPLPESFSAGEKSGWEMADFSLYKQGEEYHATVKAARTLPDGQMECSIVYQLTATPEGYQILSAQRVI